MSKLGCRYDILLICRKTEVIIWKCRLEPSLFIFWVETRSFLDSKCLEFSQKTARILLQIYCMPQILAVDPKILAENQNFSLKIAKFSLWAAKFLFNVYHVILFFSYFKQNYEKLTDFIYRFETFSWINKKQTEGSSDHKVSFSH